MIPKPATLTSLRLAGSAPKLVGWLVASLILCLPFCACSRPSPGLIELRHSRDAIRSATSWQEDTSVQFPTGQWAILDLSKMECPGRSEETAVLREQHNITNHQLIIDGVLYSPEGGGVWRGLGKAPVPFVNCGQGPRPDMGRDPLR